MARAPKMPMADPAAGADTGDDTDTGAGDDMGGDTGDDMDDGGSEVLVTISSDGQGGYIVTAGDEDDTGGEGESADDDAAMGAAAGGGGAGGAPGAGPMGAGAPGAGAGGQHCDSIGSALKATLDILNASASSAGAPGSADDQLAAGYGGDQSATPATGRPSRGLKYPPTAVA